MRTHEHVHDPVFGIPTQETRSGGLDDPDPPRGRSLTIAVGFATFPYWITVRAGEVIAIDQQYIP